MKVAHFIKRYLPRSETFIYEEIKNIKEVSQVLLTKRIENLELFPYYPIETFKNPNLFKDVLKENDVRLIHARFAYGGIEILNLSKRLGIPLLTTFYGMDISRFPRHLLYKRKLLRLFQEGDMFLVRSHMMKEDVVDLGCHPDKIHVLYGGIDIDRFCYRKMSDSNSKIRILMCGRFVEKKGFEYGIQAFKEVSSRHKDIELRIIGYGRLEKRLKKLCKRLSLEESVKFLGPLSYEKVRDEMYQATIFLAPSITARNGDKEGIPNTIKEAMAVGLPVVSTYHAGIPELVKDGKTGFLVKERDIDGLVERLNYLITHPEIWEEFGKNGRKVVEDKFNLKRQIERLEELYKRLWKIGV